MKLPGVQTWEYELLCEILRKTLNPTPPVYAFGSRITENFRVNSDLDLFIDSKTPLAGHVMLQLKDELEQNRLSFRVDPLEKSALRDDLVESIQQLPKIRICREVLP